MGFLDKAKEQLDGLRDKTTLDEQATEAWEQHGDKVTHAVDQHADKIDGGIDSAGDFISEKTGAASTSTSTRAPTSSVTVSTGWTARTTTSARPAVRARTPDRRSPADEGPGRCARAPLRSPAGPRPACVRDPPS